MGATDTARVVFWSLHLILVVPWTFYSAFRFYRYRNYIQIKERYPVMTLTCMLCLNLSALSLALSRLIEYPCPASLWHDWVVAFMFPAFGTCRGLAHYFKYESALEKVRFFKRAGGGNDKDLFFHHYKKWFSHRAMTRNFILALVLLSILPWYGTAITHGIVRNTLYVSDLICKPGFLQYVYLVPFLLSAVAVIIIGMLIRKSNDVYNIREDLKHMGMITVCTWSLFFICGYFGLVQGFSLSIVMIAIGDAGVCYFITWRPVTWCLEQERFKSSSEEAATGISTTESGKDSSQLLQMKELTTLFSEGRFKNFFSFVQQPSNRERFELFVTEAFAIENLYFYDAMMLYYEEVHHAMESEDKDQARKNLLCSAVNLFEKFLHPDAVLLVNVSAKSKVHFEKRLCDAISQSQGKMSDAEHFSGLDTLREFDLESLRSIYKECFDEVLGMLVDGLYRQFNTRHGQNSSTAPTQIRTIPLE
jgi:hypothetical protein